MDNLVVAIGLLLMQAFNACTEFGVSGAWQSLVVGSATGLGAISLGLLHDDALPQRSELRVRIVFPIFTVGIVMWPILLGFVLFAVPFQLTHIYFSIAGKQAFVIFSLP